MAGIRKPEYLKFEDSRLHKGGKTRTVNVISERSGQYLGVIRWYGRWRQYTFHPHALTVWNPQCLMQIAYECDSMTKAHREMLRRQRAGEAQIS